jgi:hypothetical protein
MNCNICACGFNSADIRMRTELRGICLKCAEEFGFKGMTVEETARCVSMIRVVNQLKNQTPSQARHMKDMET